jgi:proton-translocating NADH-quinone oxidoreductase chain M
VPADAVETIDGVGTLALEARGPESRPLEPRIREQFQAVVRGLAADARQRRIERAGLPESLLTPVALRFGGMAEPAGTIQTRGLLPTAAGGVFVLLAVLTMTGAFYPAIDAIAGEKERGTIETLLIAPCAAIDIVAGKFLAVWAVALATLVANVVSIVLTAAVAVRFLPDNAALMPEGSLPTILVVSLLAFVGLSAVAVIYTSLVALVQSDMKKLIAYSSVAHMAIVTIGLFAFNQQGIEGAMIVMLSHGLVSAALFLCVGVIYDRLHTREISRYGGLSINMPRYAVLFLLFTMASIGLPGTSGFVGEFLSLAGAYQVSTIATLLCTTGIILGAGYMLYLYRRIAFGEIVHDDVRVLPDLSAREMALLVPIAAAVLWMGVYPESFLAPMRDDATTLVARVSRATPAGDSLPTPGNGGGTPAAAVPHAEAH